MQWYRFYNFLFFRSSHWRFSVREGVLENFAIFTGKHLWQNFSGKDFLIKLQSEATASNLSRVFSWRFFVYFISTEKWDMLDRVQIFTFFARVSSICLTSKILKEIWQMVILSENVYVFKESLLLQFSCLEEFR